MKSQALIMLLFMFTLASCGGGGKGSAQLEISRGFATGNASFDGGLYVHGTNTVSGDYFSLALTTTQKATVDLAFGSWDIRVVGWDNAPLPFQGDVLCARQLLTLRAIIKPFP